MERKERENGREIRQVLSSVGKNAERRSGRASQSSQVLSSCWQWLQWSTLPPPAAGAERTSYSCATIACPLVLPTAETAQSIQPAIALNQLSTWFLLAVTKKLFPFISLLVKEVATSSFLIGYLGKTCLKVEGCYHIEINAERSCTDLPPGKKSQKLK